MAPAGIVLGHNVIKPGSAGAEIDIFYEYVGGIALEAVCDNIGPGLAGGVPDFFLVAVEDGNGLRRQIANEFGLLLPVFFKAADRKSTRLNSSHVKTSYAVFCLKKKTRT